MTDATDATRRAGTPSSPTDEADGLIDEGFAAPEDEGTDVLSEETGIDLSDASGLDADNVPADEESGRTVQAPD